MRTRPSPRLVLAASGAAAAALAAAAPAPASGRADLDGDGRDDCWEATYSGGSGFGGTVLTVHPGCGKPSSTLDTYGSFGELLEAAPIHGPAPRDALLSGMTRLIYGSGAIRSLDDAPAVPRPDGSFRWLLAAFQGAPRPGVVPFREVRRVLPHWADGPPALPPTQAVLLRDPTYARTARALDPTDPEPDLGFAKRPSRAPFAVVGYRAHNHGALREAGRCGPWRVFSTAHGVAVFGEVYGRHAWVWLVTGATKLRWPSVRAVHCVGGLLVVARTVAGPVDLVVIDPPSGSFGVVDPGADAWRIDGDVLVIGVERHEAAALAAALRPPRDWAWRSDLDGDGRPDRIEVSFSGGAHCCYTVAVTASRTAVRHALPFELDGGYVGGLDLSRPGHFDVADYDRDGLLDLFLEIETYGSTRLPLAPAVVRAWGIRTHEVVVSFASGRPVARDLGRL